VRLLLALLWMAPAGAEELTTSSAHEVRRVPPPPCPIRGPRFAAVTLDLYFAFGHGPSAVGAELARRAVENARLHDVRELVRLAPPGPISNSPGAQLAAEALIEAEKQGRAFEFIDRMLRERAGLSVAELVRTGVDAGLDGEALAAALSDHRHQPIVEERLKESVVASRAAGELMVNGRRSSVWVSEEGLSATISEARKRAEALLDSGVPLGRVYEQLTQPASEDPPHSSSTPQRKRLQPDLTGAPSRGPSLAPVTIVIFSNLACVTCGDTAEALRKLREAWPGRIREVYRNFVPAYVSSAALEVHAAALAAGAAQQGRFWALHDALFGATSSALPRRSKADLDAAARLVGLDFDKRNVHAERAVIDRDQAEARRLSVPFAPTIIINGLMFAGAASFDRLDRMVRAEMERGMIDRLTP
jgi:protein-disulfide isomerase